LRESQWLAKEAKKNLITKTGKLKLLHTMKNVSVKRKKYLSKHVIVSGSDNSGLTVEENEVLELFLNGVSCGQIASQYEVEEEVITGLLEIIRAKLSLGDECSN